MSDRLFDVDPVPALNEVALPFAPQIPPDAPVEGLGILPQLTKFELQVKTNERRGRMRPRRLAKLKCEHCPWTGKTLPVDTPAACPSCSRTGCLVMIGWASR